MEKKGVCDGYLYICSSNNNDLVLELFCMNLIMFKLDFYFARQKSFLL
jgi:hypothetical protein